MSLPGESPGPPGQLKVAGGDPLGAGAEWRLAGTAARVVDAAEHALDSPPAAGGADSAGSPPPAGAGCAAPPGSMPPAVGCSAAPPELPPAPEL